ncbi:MAG TPA: DUF4153 domain-containing protein [Candidatus Limnocylindrales bacterium]|nr:DUF4153 domain-containing protein [Candidatus Limnocylindrales bacterium]
MNLLSGLKGILFHIQRSIKRAPIAFGLSVILAVLLIILSEHGPFMTVEALDRFKRISMLVGLGILLALCIGLLNENFFSGDRLKSLLKNLAAYLVGASVLFLYHLFFIQEIGSFVSGVRYIAVALFLALSLLFIPRLNKKENYEAYVLKVFTGLLITAIYSAVLYSGIAAIIFATDNLFEFGMPSAYYYYSFLLVGSLFSVPLFLSKLPDRDDDQADYSYSRALEIILLNIAIPLITIYTAILYLYFVQILIVWEWPKGVITNLVLWYSVLGVGVLFLLTPILKENPVGNLFKTWFPKLIMPLLGLMFIAIGIRINQYGFTESRYYVVLLGAWVTGFMLYFSVAKSIKNIIIPISLAIIVFIAVFGPLSSFTVSIMSQNARLNYILTRNEMITNGTLISNSNISLTDRIEISNIVMYFDRYHSLADIAVVPDDFDKTRMRDIFGFEFQPQHRDIPAFINFYYFLDLAQEPISISNFDYFLVINMWNEKFRKIDSIRVEYDTEEYILDVYDGTENILSRSLMGYIQEIHVRNTNGVAELASMSFDGENEKLRYTIIFTSVSGYLDHNEEITITDAAFTLLLDVK